MRILFFIFIFVVMGFSKTNNQIDDGYTSKSIEQGYHFYNEQNANKKDVKIKKEDVSFNITKKSSDEAKILYELLKEIRILTKEVNLIKKYINPNAPHKITCSDGKKDWANSRPECFEMPMITEARNMPALSKYMQNPTEETAGNWLGVQAKLLNRATKMGYALKFAFLNGNEKVYPTSTLSSSPTSGYANAAKAYLLKKRILRRFKDTIGTVIFLGKTPELEKELGAGKLSRILLNDLALLNPLIVFTSVEVKEQYDNFYAIINTDEKLKAAYDGAEKEILPETFDKYNINTTPSILALYNDGNDVKKTVIAKGFVNKDQVIDGLIQFLIFHDLIDPAELNIKTQWETDND